MKQKINNFLYEHKTEIINLCNYLYENPETSYNEHNSCEYICSLLSKFDFNITKNFLDIDNSFFAQKGNGYPKICFLCEYDAIEQEGHLTGHNVVTTISVAAALSLSSSLENTDSSIILIGCPGEYLGGSKGIMTRQGVFDDIDVVMMAHPDINTYESGSSSAIIPVGLCFEGKNELSFINKDLYTPLDAALLTINILNSIKKLFPKNLEITYVISNGGFTPLLSPSKCEIKFYIRAKTAEIAVLGDNKLREIAESVSNLTNIKSKFFLYEQPNKELITNRTLTRLFSHNLKESGIINIDSPKDVFAGLSIGDVSHKVPTIHPYISITDNSDIKYGSKDFAKETISDYCISQSLIAAKALAYTGFDLINNETLLKEVKNEFFN